jgi:DNA polymerase-3 subunit gamma/tau
MPVEASGQFAVDDEPEDAAATTRVATLAPPREGDVLPRSEVAPSVEPDEDDQPEAIVDVPVPPTIAPPLTSAATTRAPSSPRPGTVQRYGEAVVRQVLGATFVREEPYEPPTRFS